MRSHRDCGTAAARACSSLRRREAVLTKGEHRSNYREVEAGLLRRDGTGVASPAAEAGEEEEEDGEAEQEEMPDELRVIAVSLA